MKSSGDLIPASCKYQNDIIISTWSQSNCSKWRKKLTKKLKEILQDIGSLELFIERSYFNILRRETSVALSCEGFITAASLQFLLLPKLKLQSAGGFQYCGGDMLCSFVVCMFDVDKCPTLSLSLVLSLALWSVITTKHSLSFHTVTANH